MAFDPVQADAGSGGESFAFDQFLDADNVLKTMAYSAIAFGPLNGPYSVVTTYDPFPCSDTPTSPQTSQSSDIAVAAGSSADLTSTAITSGKTGKLSRVEATASVPIKMVLKRVLDGIETVVLVRFGWQGVIDWTPPHKDYVQVPYSETAGIDGFRVTITNLDPSRGADLYAFFAWDEVDL